MHDETQTVPPGAMSGTVSNGVSSAEYGRLESRNIASVAFGDHIFETWYGNSAYFLSPGDKILGIDQDPVNSRRRGYSPGKPGFWINLLHVCDSCFKYTVSSEAMAAHKMACSLQTQYPPLGKLVYSDVALPLLIKRIRGFRHPLFCQNLALFGKLFLDDKSVFYNVEAFDFYVVYGNPDYKNELHSSLLALLKPMGFFSKEVNAWESDNNLACVCIFPPFQRLGLGSLLLEFLYALARVTPGQLRLGPEFPLSPFGKALYLRFWSKQLLFLILHDLKDCESVTLSQLADVTGFRTDDILMTLEYMGVLQKGIGEVDVSLLMLNTREWCRRNGINTDVLGNMLNPDCLLV